MAALRSPENGGGNPGSGRPKTLCVFCGSQVGNDRRYAAAAERLGKLLAKAHVRLVYGGGGIGLMGVLARSVLQAGGLAIGVVPGFLRELEVQQQGLTELVVTETMHERKFLMYDMADAFAVLPGGIGTLEEITELISWRHLGVHVKPIVLIDVADYWQPFCRAHRACGVGRLRRRSRAPRLRRRRAHRRRAGRRGPRRRPPRRSRPKVRI